MRKKITIIFIIIFIAIFFIFLAFWKIFIFNNTNISSIENGQPATINKTKEEVYQTKVIFMGDVMLARSIGDLISSGKDPFMNISETISKYDLRVANIETTIADPEKSIRSPGKLYTFNAPLKSLEIIKKNNINIANLANNHTRDYGAAATSDMIDRLIESGIIIAGAGKNIDKAFSPVITDVEAKPTIDKNVEIQKIKIAIISFNTIENTFTNVTPTQAGSAYYDKDRILSAINESKSLGAEIIIAIPHWGVEYQTEQNSNQSNIGHFLIDSGVDIVIGGHPHVIQPTELYKEKYIIYSLGNLIFDQMEGASDGHMVDLGLTMKANLNSDGRLTNKSISINAPTYIKTRMDSLGFPKITN